jgi:hypothetical protein
MEEKEDPAVMSCTQEGSPWRRSAWQAPAGPAPPDDVMWLHYHEPKSDSMSPLRYATLRP